MFERKRVTLFLLAMVMSFAAVVPAACTAEDAPRITKEEVRPLIGDPGVVILDARTGWSWEESDRKIKGAVRVDPADVGSWAGNLAREKKIIVYCA